MLLSGGETTVTVSGGGRGGRNTEFLLALAVALEAHPAVQSRVWALAADTDGIDGDQECAGAVVTPQTLTRARRLGMDPATFLAHNDSGGFFAPLGDVVVTRPPCTNVNDFRSVYIGGGTPGGSRPRRAAGHACPRAAPWVPSVRGR